MTVIQKVVAHTSNNMMNMFISTHCLFRQPDLINSMFMAISMITSRMIMAPNILNGPGFFIVMRS